jgi:predicted DNA-binding ribbon-helix-helix protein
MCRIFAHQPQRNYESQTRSLRIGGHSTSVRLEMAFWDTLEEIASHHGEASNFASLLRCCCLIYTSSRAGAATPPYQGINRPLETAE